MHLKETGEQLYYNDMSLRCQGKFSISGDPSQPDKHFEHRVGENIDMNNENVRGGKRDQQLEKRCTCYGLAVYAELLDRHYHLRLLRVAR